MAATSVRRSRERQDVHGQRGQAPRQLRQHSLGVDQGRQLARRTHDRAGQLTSCPPVRAVLTSASSFARRSCPAGAERHDRLDEQNPILGHGEGARAPASANKVCSTVAGSASRHDLIGRAGPGAFGVDAAGDGALADPGLSPISRIGISHRSRSDRSARRPAAMAGAISSELHGAVVRFGRGPELLDVAGRVRDSMARAKASLRRASVAEPSPRP